MKPVIMTGDEAVARGAWEAGVTFAAAYPGTPSTEIMENIAQYKKDIYCLWTCNEKVAMEAVSGASIGGARAMASMKHVGLNVAADPLFTMGYIGANGGVVVVSADDPGCHSSQTEQDNRLYAPLAKLCLIEASDSQECKDFAKLAFEISEKFDIPVLFRMTTRVCHSKSLVHLGNREEVGVKPYIRNIMKNAMLPAAARARHAFREKSLLELEEYGCTSPLNRVEYNRDLNVGIITSGISYQHSREVFGDEVSYLKLGLTYPIPKKLVEEFASKVGKLYVIEEGEPFLENQVKAIGIPCVGKELVPICGELNAEILCKSFARNKEEDLIYASGAKAPSRPPVLCAGCPHRGFFFALNRNKDKAVSVGDIGCYALGISAPLDGFDISICMGSGLSVPIGFAKALEHNGDKRKVFGMVGDSTFFHSGINSLIDVVHSQANICACILDNSITAMTGHQENSGTSIDLMGEPATAIDLVALVRATGIGEDRIRIVNPLDLAEMDGVIKAAIEVKGPFVIITKAPCVLLKPFIKSVAGKYCKIDADKCKGCKGCMKPACPAMAFLDGKAKIVDTAACTACGLCMQLCKFGAIEKVGE